MEKNAQAGMEVIVIMGILFLVFVVLAVLFIYQGDQTTVLKSSLDKQSTCNRISGILSQLHSSGPGAKWTGELFGKDVNVFTSGFLDVSNHGKNDAGFSCSFFGSVDQDYDLTPGTLTFENIDGQVVITNG